MNSGISLLRFVLAFNVVAFHIWNALAPGAGPVAVLAFFFISGLLITQITQEVYNTWGRAWDFLVNRFLRIYPQYLAAVLLSLLCVYEFPELAEHVNGYIVWPGSAKDWIPQFAIMGLFGADVRLLPAAWSLGTEIYYYLVIGLVTGRSKRLALALFAISIPVGALCALGVLPFIFYGSPVGNGFAFAFGSVMYFYRDAVRIGGVTFAIAACAYFLHTYGIPYLEQTDLDDANLAASLLPFAVMVLYFEQHDFRNPRAVSVLNVMGKLAYPMFLTHWIASMLVSRFLFGGLAGIDNGVSTVGAVYFLSTLAVVLVISALFYRCIDVPLESLRRLVRQHARRAPAAALGSP